MIAKLSHCFALLTPVRGFPCWPRRWFSGGECQGGGDPGPPKLTAPVYRTQTPE